MGPTRLLELEVPCGVGAPEVACPSGTVVELELETSLIVELALVATASARVYLSNVFVKQVK
jgi:hypothetical protein